MLIACLGMIRSGSTLQYNFARALVEQLELGRGEGFFKLGETPDLERRLAGWAANETVHVVKMHSPKALAALPREDGSVRACYIFRDIRDVAASAKRIWRTRGAKLLAALDEAVATYYEARKLPSVLVWKYEDVIENPAPAVSGLAAFLDIEAPTDTVAAVVEQCSLKSAKLATAEVGGGRRETARRILRRLGLARESVYHAKHLLHTGHVSETDGRAGIWREVLDETECETISSRYAGWLREQGYGA